MSSQYYTPTGNPPAQSRGTSPTIRAEYSLVDAGFQKLPTPAQVWADAQNYAADAGTVNAYAVTIAATFLTSYFAGMKVKFKAGNTNTGASTLSVNALGNIAIVRPDGVTALTAGTIVSGQIVECIYDGLSFQMANSANVTSNNDPGAIQKQTYTAFTTGGTSTAFTLSPTPALIAYADNESFYVNFHAACGNNPTINISGLGALPLKKLGFDGVYTALSASDFLSGQGSRVTIAGGLGPFAIVENIAAMHASDSQGQKATAFLTAGTGTAYTLTAAPVVAAYAEFLSFFVRFHAASGATPTLNVNGLGASVQLVKQLPDGTFGNVAAGDIQAGHRSRVTFLSTTQALVETFAQSTALSDFQKQTASAVTTGGTGTAYTATPSPAWTSYVAGQTLWATFNVISGASPTLNVSGLGATVNLVKQQGDGTYTNIVATDIPASHRSRVTLLSTTQALVEILPATGKLIGVRVISSTQTYTPSAGTTRVQVLLQGGGGAGGGTAVTGAGQQATGAGGSAGGWAISFLSAGFSGVTITIGAAGVAASGATGGNGGTTSFGAVFSATGGPGGGAGSALANTLTAFSAGPSGGTGSGGNVLNATGGSGGAGLYTPSGGVLSGYGGASYFGQGGNSTTAAANGNTATTLGAGGSGAAQTASGGALQGGSGASGIAIIWEYT